jgi:hypothetical protein
MKHSACLFVSCLLGVVHGFQVAPALSTRPFLTSPTCRRSTAPEQGDDEGTKEEKVGNLVADDEWEGMTSLTQESVEKAIDEACQYETGGKAETLKLSHGLTVERIQDWQPIIDGTVVKDVDASSDYLKSKTPWHFGISVRKTHNEIVGCATFYIAYSSWNGRILYIDRLECKSLNDETEELLLRILADVALALNCVRLTWRVGF